MTNLSNIEGEHIMNSTYSVLKQLALSVRRIIEDFKFKGSIKPEIEVYFRWKVDKFEYSDEGITKLSRHGEYISKPSWFHSIFKLVECIKKTSEYTLALEHLNESIFHKGDLASYTLENFVKRLLHEYLFKPKLDEASIETHIITFLNELKRKPVSCSAMVELDGIILNPDNIELSSGIILRRTRIEDLEIEFHRHSFMPFHLLLPPTAILNINFLGRQPIEIQREVEKSIPILRLFKVGSVKWIRYRMFSDSIINPISGTLTSSGTELTLEKYLITEDDGPKLKKFWQIMSEVIPRSFYELGKVKMNYLTVAYNRYNDSLFKNGVIERRITNAIMGLEALFLKSGEIHELVYRLSLRVSKLLNSLGYNLHKVKEIITKSYRVRSHFVHGGLISRNKKRKLASKYGNLKNILQQLLNYLRTSIIIMILVDRRKDEFIDLIDKALIDKQKEKILNDIVSRVKEPLN